MFGPCQVHRDTFPQCARQTAWRHACHPKCGITSSAEIAAPEGLVRNGISGMPLERGWVDHGDRDRDVSLGRCRVGRDD